MKSKNEDDIKINNRLSIGPKYPVILPCDRLRSRRLWTQGYLNRFR